MRKLVLIFGPIEVSIPILLAPAATLKAGPGGDLAFLVGENRRPLTEGASATYSARPQDRWCGGSAQGVRCGREPHARPPNSARFYGVTHLEFRVTPGTRDGQKRYAVTEPTK